MVECDLATVERLIQTMKMNADVTSHQEDKMGAVAIAVERDPDTGTVQDPEWDANQDPAITQEVTGEVDVDVVNNRVMAIAQEVIGEAEVEKAAIWEAFQDIQTISI